MSKEQSPATSHRSKEALRLARAIVSDPVTRAKIKRALLAEGKPGLAALIDEAVLVSRELIRLTRAR